MEYNLLPGIKGPEDVKAVPEDKLPDLCAEIREKLIETVSSNGGHLASNLGTVELTVALHRCFRSPDDKIIWDVSHQAYTHKLLTGRYGQFSTLRTEGGLSGFTRPDESEHDISYEGHAGTAVSRACGIAAANALKGTRDYTIAVVGDGSFGNGLVYEAMNNAEQIKGRLIVILNDNEMSIGESVGALAGRLAKVRAKPEYYRFKARTEKLLNKIPLVGRHLANGIFKIKNFLKNLIYKSSMFEDMGFRYIGPIDGHDIGTLCEALNSAKLVTKPVLLHINTVKGRGYDFAEENPGLYHGVSEFNAGTGITGKGSENYSSHFGSLMCEFASKDKRICAVTAAMTAGTGLEPFFEKYPDRAFDVGIAEGHAVTFCSGLSAGGMIPVFAVYSTFLQRAVDEIIQDAALQRRKMIIAVDRAGFVGEDGETHQGLFDIALMKSVPGAVIYSPASYKELGSALYNALYRREGLVFIRYPRGAMPAGGDDMSEGADFEVYGNENAPVTAVTYGRLWFDLLGAANILRDKGADIKIIKLNLINPIPEGAVDAACGSEKVFFFEEGMKSGGAGETFAGKLLEKGCEPDYRHIAVDGQFVLHASVASQKKKYGLDAESMAATILKEISDE